MDGGSNHTSDPIISSAGGFVEISDHSNLVILDAKAYKYTNTNKQIAN